MAVFETFLESDLKKPLQVKKLDGCFYSDDKNANKITVKVYDNGANATLSGTVRGSIIRDDNATLTVDGSLSGNTASIVLPTNSYAVPGPIHIVIRLFTGTGDNQVKTVLGACTGYVWQTTTDTVIDNEHIVPSIDDILALIDTMEDATDDCVSATAKITGLTAVASTLAAGASATASIITTSGHYQINLGIPQGIKGDQGDVSATQMNNKFASDAFLTVAGTAIASGDLDTYTTPHNYRVADATAAGNITNSPITTEGYTLKVFASQDSNTKMQWVISSSGASMYFRRYSNSVWSSWVKYVASTATTSAAGYMSATDKTELDKLVATGMRGFSGYTGADLNDLQTPGIWWIVSTTTTTNWPSSVNLSSATFAMVEVLKSSATSPITIQRLTIYASGIVYIRYHNNGTWYSWMRLSPGNIGTYTGSLDTLTDTGDYWCNTTVTTDGWPTSRPSNYGFIEVRNSSIILQRISFYRNANPPQMCSRIYANGYWSAWSTLTSA